MSPVYPQVRQILQMGKEPPLIAPTRGEGIGRDERYYAGDLR